MMYYCRETSKDGGKIRRPQEPRQERERWRLSLMVSVRRRSALVRSETTAVTRVGNIRIILHDATNCGHFRRETCGVTLLRPSAVTLGCAKAKAAFVTKKENKKTYDDANTAEPTPAVQHRSSVPPWLRPPTRPLVLYHSFYALGHSRTRTLPRSPLIHSIAADSFRVEKSSGLICLRKKAPAARFRGAGSDGGSDSSGKNDYEKRGENLGKSNEVPKLRPVIPGRSARIGKRTRLSVAYGMEPRG
ncbi:hypothetical protein MRX96_039905 [Rhipicephalus microplus]